MGTAELGCMDFEAFTWAQSQLKNFFLAVLAFSTNDNLT